MTRSLRVALWLAALVVAATTTAPDTTWGKLESFVKARAQLAMRAVNSFTTWAFNRDLQTGGREMEDGKVKTDVDAFEGVGEADDSTYTKAEYEAAKEWRRQI